MSSERETALNFFSDLSADADAAGDFERLTFHAADPTGPDGDVVLPAAILSDAGGVHGSSCSGSKKRSRT